MKQTTIEYFDTQDIHQPPQIKLPQARNWKGWLFPRLSHFNGKYMHF